MFLPLLLALAITPTLTPTPTPENIIPQLDDVQKIRQAVQQKVQEKLKEITTPITVKKAVIGTVIQNNDSEITIDYQGQPRVLKVGTDTTVIDLKRNKINFGKIAIGQDILAMGYHSSDTNQFDAKRIVFIDLKTITNQYQIVFGKVADISQTSSIITLLSLQNKDQQYSIKTSKTTSVISSKSQKLTYASLKRGDRLVSVIKIDPKSPKISSTEFIISLDYQPSPTPTQKP